MLVFLALIAGNQIATIASLFLLGGFGFATLPGAQIRVMSHASSASTLASGANIAVVVLASVILVNAVGAWLGGLAIMVGLGYTSPFWAGAALTALGLMVMVVRRAVRVPPLSGHPSPQRWPRLPKAPPRLRSWKQAHARTRARFPRVRRGGLAAKSEKLSASEPQFRAN